MPPEKPTYGSELQHLFERINESWSDFSLRPVETVFDRGSSGDYPLHKFAIIGDIAAAQMLIAAGADVNALGEDGDTPLHRAVTGRHAAIIRLLVEKGADTSIEDRYGHSPIDAARMTQIDGIVQATTIR